MTLEQLRIFVAVAERAHVTQAARALNLTPSAVSSAVTALEARHAVALFDRVGRSIVLNPAGQVFLVEAREVLARATAAEAALAGLGDLSRGRLAIHASQTIANYWLPPRLTAFRRAYPGIALSIAIGNSAQVALAVTDGVAELGFVEGDVDAPALSVRVVDHDRLSLIVGRAHPWAAARSSAGLDLMSTAWVLREPGSGTRAAFEAALARRGLGLGDLEITLVLPSNEAVRAAVEAGAGAAVMAHSVAAAGLASAALVEAPFDLPPRAYSLLRHKARYHSPAAEAFLALP